MGYAVLHLDKASGNEAKMTAHIERTQMPKNADPERTNLNRELIEFPDGVSNRTEAIQHRLDTAGLTRKIGSNQVRAIRVMLTGSHDEMKRIEATGRLDEWCADNLKWLRETYGTANVVSATLHLDEATPHIHATVVPIVTGERRKAAAKPAEPGKNKYRKKPANAVRLCADDVMTHVKLKEYQDSYAGVMRKYGLERGIVGSDARHITTQEFYRNAIARQGDLQDDIEELLKVEESKRQAVEDLVQQEQDARTHTEQATAEKQQAETDLADKQSELRQVKGELKAEKFKSTAADAGTKIAQSVGSLFGSSKIERQQQEIEALRAENTLLKMQSAGKDAQIRNLQHNHQSEIERLRHSHDRDMAAKQTKLDRIAFWFPDIPQMAATADYCREVGFSHEQTKTLLILRPVQYTGVLRSPKSGRTYAADGVTARLERRADTGVGMGAGVGANTGTITPGFTLTINSISILQWFRQQFDKLGKAIGRKVPDNRRNKGIKL